jgi:NDP-sugar pyrophosphorylase family protein
VVCVGYRGDQIVEQIGPERFGIRIWYSHDGPRPLGTLGAIRAALPKLGPRFLFLYGDTFLRIDYAAAAAAWERSALPGMMAVLRNEDRWDVSNVSFDGYRVTAYDKQAPTASMQWIDYGLGGLERGVLEVAGEEATELADLQHELAERGLLFGFEAIYRFYEIGTPEALATTAAFLSDRRDTS